MIVVELLSVAKYKNCSKMNKSGGKIIRNCSKIYDCSGIIESSEYKKCSKNGQKWKK